MRVTVLDDDPGERIVPGRERIAVYLNGEEVSRCITADDEAGEVVEVATDERGRIVTENGDVIMQQAIRNGSFRRLNVHFERNLHDFGAF